MRRRTRSRGRTRRRGLPWARTSSAPSASTTPKARQAHREIAAVHGLSPDWSNGRAQPAQPAITQPDRGYLPVREPTRSRRESGHPQGRSVKGPAGVDITLRACRMTTMDS
jgi:hypothetical protein